MLSTGSCYCPLSARTPSDYSPPSLSSAAPAPNLSYLFILIPVLFIVAIIVIVILWRKRRWKASNNTAPVTVTVVCAFIFSCPSLSSSLLLLLLILSLIDTFIAANNSSVEMSQVSPPPPPPTVFVAPEQVAPVYVPPYAPTAVEAPSPSPYTPQNTHNGGYQPMCFICRMAPIEQAFAPCGHMACCNTCGVSQSTCFVCQQPVTGLAKLY